MKKIIFGWIGCFAAVILCAEAGALSADKEKQYRAFLEKLSQSVTSLVAKTGGVFAPGAAKAEAGAEEIGWRMRDIQELTEKIRTLSVDYNKNETQILESLDKWFEQARLVDEAMIYAAVSPEISDLWKGTKDLAMLARDCVQEIPSKEELSRECGGHEFEVVKVGRYEKKQVLVERVKEFTGGDQMDKFPFPDEKRFLDTQNFGEQFIIRFRVKTLGVPMMAPVKLRFEYKFVNHNYDGSQQVLYPGLVDGGYEFVFKNQGNDYTNRGKLIHWRACLLLNDRVVAQKRSPMWKIVSE